MSPASPVQTEPKRHLPSREVIRRAHDAWQRGDLAEADRLLSELEAWHPEGGGRSAWRLRRWLDIAGRTIDAPEVHSWIAGSGPLPEDTGIYVFFEVFDPGRAAQALASTRGLHQRAEPLGLPVVGLTTLARGTDAQDVEGLLEREDARFPVARTHDTDFLTSIGATGPPWSALVVDGRLVWAGYPNHFPVERLDDIDAQRPR